MRRYDESIEVRAGQVAGLPAPEQFLWRGRRWLVRGVLGHWIETGEWWHSASARAVRGDDTDRAGTAAGAALRPRSAADLLGEREVWRLEAGTGGSSGAFELAHDRTEGSWRLLGCSD